MRYVVVLTTACALVVTAAPMHAQSAPARTGSVSSTSNTHANRAETGLRLGGLPRPGPDGAPRWADFPVVRGVEPGSAADKVGIQPGDVVLQVNGIDARDPRTLFAPPGTTFTLRVRRGAAVREFVMPTPASSASLSQPARG
jgi:S1-C subfamily serine protease